MGLVPQGSRLGGREVLEYKEESGRSVSRGRSIVALLQLKHIVMDRRQKVLSLEPKFGNLSLRLAVNFCSLA